MKEQPPKLIVKYTTEPGVLAGSVRIIRTPWNKDTDTANGEPWHVATVTDGVLDYTSAEARAKHAAVKRRINEWKIAATKVTICGQDPEKFAPPVPEVVVSPTVPVSGDQVTVTWPADGVKIEPIIHVAEQPDPAKRMPNIHNRRAMLEWLAKYHPDVPPFPEMGPDAEKGDAIVLWLQKHFESDFNRIYGVIGPGYVEDRRIGRNPDGSRKIETYKRPCLLAVRKTIATEKTSGGEEIP